MLYALEETTYTSMDNIRRHQVLLPLSQMNEESKREYWATLALRHCKKLGVRTQNKLLKYFGSAFCAIDNINDWQAAGLDQSYSKEMSKELWRKAAKSEWESALHSDALIILWISDYYPVRLREICDPPPLLYCRGNIQFLRGPAIAIVGSRNATTKGLNIAYLLGNGLSSCGISVVSGMAYGIDREAHKGALNGVGSSIGVLGTGIDVEYPRSNKNIYQQMYEKGLIISEFPPKTAPTPTNFPIRNRIISGISLGVVVVEAAERSGSLITARLALEQNRDIFAVPGATFSSDSIGCQNLIRQGAKPVFELDDILLELSDVLSPFKLMPPPTISTNQPKDLPVSNITTNINTELLQKQKQEKIEILKNSIEEEIPRKIFECLSEKGIIHIDSLADILNMDINELNSQLTLMEVRGLIKRLPGAKFEVV